ncbi:MAG: Holliday junction resolvase RecU [Erysipelotrichaceae bacterium]|nr:Holliday junction resolvase RecU [Erysipelotrichaceae bacterium]
MKYPNGKQAKSTDRKISASRRGMSLEEDINISNSSYLAEDLAVIHKKPTPVTIVKVDYPKREKARIEEAYFKLPSTTDYNGIYKGRYIDFEAKECHSKTSFPFSSIHPHQVEHLASVLRHGAIAFLIIRMSAYDKDFLIDAGRFLDFYNSGQRKSLSYKWILENGTEIAYNYKRPCDYLRAIDKVYKI